MCSRGTRLLGAGHGGDDGKCRMHEVAVLGEPPTRRLTRRRLLIGASAACLVMGFLAGGQSDTLTGSDTADAAFSSLMPVTAGAIGKVKDAEHGAEFQRSVFNSGGDEIDVTILDLDGWGGTLLDSPSATVAPDTWGAVSSRHRPTVQTRRPTT